MVAVKEQMGASLKVVGVGGGGCNAVEDMIAQGVANVVYICANTDQQALAKSRADIKIQLGQELTSGLGAGANPEIGRLAAEESIEAIREVLRETDMLFITAGMGGGTGTGAAPVIARIAREENILTVAIVTKPFHFEGEKRMHIANDGIEKLHEYVDSLITIPNNKLLSVLGKSVTLVSAFRSVNTILQGAVQGIADLITQPGLINVDFADVRTVMSEMGRAMMGTGFASGEDRAEKAAQAAVSSPLLEDIDLRDAKGILVNITSSSDMSIGEFEIVGDTVRQITSVDATVVIGTVIDPEMTEDLRVTVVVTGLPDAMSEGAAKVTPPPAVAHNVSRRSRNFDPVGAVAKAPAMARPSLLRQQSATTKRQESADFQIPAFLRDTQEEES